MRRFLQGGRRPAVTKVTDQRRRIQQALRLHARRSLIIAQMGGLGSRHGGVVHRARRILVKGDLGAAVVSGS
jgi:hypothetical protein